MNLLLDTHTFLWFISGDRQLSERARALIEDKGNVRYLSTAALWEITIKAGYGRLAVPMPPSLLYNDHVRGNGITVLPIAESHLDRLYTLPLHHKDPFDRLMIAQAIAENMTILTRDGKFSAYGVRIDW